MRLRGRPRKRWADTVIQDAKEPDDKIHDENGKRSQKTRWKHVKALKARYAKNKFKYAPELDVFAFFLFCSNTWPVYVDIFFFFGIYRSLIAVFILYF